MNAVLLIVFALVFLVTVTAVAWLMGASDDDGWDE